MMINVYHYHSNDLIMLAIPELFWSIELSKELDANQLYEELVMQLKGKRRVNLQQVIG